MSDRPFIQFDASQYASATQMNQIQLDKYWQCLHDSRQANRCEQLLCSPCFYVKSFVGGATLTTSPCGICRKEMGFGSTCTDKICPECAAEYGICKHCGADLETLIEKETLDALLKKKEQP